VIVLIAGTGTEVGKTWVASTVAARLRARGREVRARKPAQSFEPGDTRTDADVLGEATGEPAKTVCPPHRWFPIPMAPPMAAAALDRPTFTIADLVADLRDDDTGILLVESAGGVRSPLADDGDTVTLAKALRPTVTVLVADAGLGTINAVRLSVAALAPHRVVVALNRFDLGDDLHVRNRDWLVRREGLEVVTDPEALADAICDASI
jgi:dethiobiotin synthetase